MTKKLYELATELMLEQASIERMSPQELEQGLSTVFITLQRMKLAEEGGVLLDQLTQALQATAPVEKASPPVQEELPAAPPAPVDAMESIKEDFVLCLICGEKMKQLTVRHLKSHDLDAKAYRKQFKIPAGQPLSARSVTKQRKEAAKKRGLPEKLLEFQEKRRQEKMKTAALEGVETDMAEKKGSTKKGSKKKSEE
jgi:predicted transcriptional regulator